MNWMLLGGRKVEDARGRSGAPGLAGLAAVGRAVWRSVLHGNAEHSPAKIQNISPTDWARLRRQQRTGRRARSWNSNLRDRTDRSASA